MPKSKLEDWDETAANNTDMGGIDLSENVMRPPAVNNEMREHMAQMAKWLGDDTVASATTTDLGSVPGRYVSVTGTTTITGFGTIKAGTIKYVKFAGALTLTHNGTSLILPGAANIATAAGDTAVFVSEGSGNWRCLAFQRDSQAPYITGTFTPTVQGSTAGGSGTYSTRDGKYTKIGNTVFFTFFVIYTGHSGTGNTLLTNLPFTCGSTPAAVSAWVSNLTFSGQVIGFVVDGTNQMQLYTANSGSSSSQIAMDPAASILVSGHYFI